MMYILEFILIAILTIFKFLLLILYALFFFRIDWKIMYFKEKVVTHVEKNGTRHGYVKYFKNGIDHFNKKEILELRKDFKEEFDFELK